MYFFEIYSKNFKILILVILFYLTFSPLKALDIESIVKDQTDKIEIAEKGKKLNEFFSENILETKINDTVKTYKFGIDDYEVFDADKSLVENGKWKVSGILKNQIKLQIKNSKDNYYFKKISQKPIIYYYDKLPGSEGSKKIQVEIISSSKIDKVDILQAKEDSQKTTNNSSTESKVSIGNTIDKGINKIFGKKENSNSLSQEKTIDAQLLKKYGATSNISYYFFEASINFLQALELLHRAYDNNVEADKINASIDYLKNSKTSEADKLKSTRSIIGTSSIKIQSSIQDVSLVLSEKGRGYYEQSLPFAFGAAETTVYLYSSSKNSLQTIGISGGLNPTSLLTNANDIGAAITILPEIPDFTKNMAQTIKLVFSGAKDKGIRDNGNYNKALKQLNLLDLDEDDEIKSNQTENTLNINNEEPKKITEEKKSKEQSQIGEIGEDKKLELSKKIESKEEDQNNKVKEIEFVKKDEPKAEEPKKIIQVKEGKVPEGKKRIFKYVCDKNKSEFYWGKTKNNMKLSRYEDSPNGKEDLGSFEALWQVTEIDFEAGYVYDSGSMKYDATGDGILNTVPFAERAKIKSHDPSQGIYISESEYSFENDPNFQEIVLEVKYSEYSLEYLLETEEYGLEYGTGKNKFWEKYTNQCIRTEYYVDKNSNGNSIKTYNEQKPIAEQAEKNIFSSQIEKQYQAQTDTLLKEINEQVLKEIGIVENQYKNVSKNINQNKDLNNESQKFVKEVSKDQLKQYKATSVITYYFFESQANYLASLELLYRAYDKNVEADKMKAQIDYLKDSKNSENKRLKSTIQIIDDASKNIRSSIGDNSKELSEESKIFYQKSLPFAFKATEYGYKVFVVSTSVGNNIANSKDKVGSILSNFNEVIGFASIIPKIPSYVKTVGGTSKLIFTGAKAKKIKDNENLGDALEELDLSA